MKEAIALLSIAIIITNATIFINCAKIYKRIARLEEHHLDILICLWKLVHDNEKMKKEKKRKTTAKK